MVFIGALCALLTVSRWSASESPDTPESSSPDVESAPEVREPPGDAPLAAPVPNPSVLLSPLPPVPPPAVPALVPQTTAAPAPPAPKPPKPIVRVPPSVVSARLPAGKRDFDSLLRAQRSNGGEAPLRESFKVPTQSEAGEDTPAVRPDEAFEIEYTFDPELSSWVFTLLAKGRVELGHVIVADARSGRILTYASTDPRRFPPTRLYPAASLVKVVTAAAALPRSPDLGRRDCVYSRQSVPPDAGACRSSAARASDQLREGSGPVEQPVLRAARRAPARQRATAREHPQLRLAELAGPRDIPRAARMRDRAATTSACSAPGSLAPRSRRCMRCRWR